MYELPDGWDLDRVRAHGGLRDEPRLVPLDTTVFDNRIDDLVELHPVAIIDCGGLLLVLDRDDRCWYVGMFDDDCIVCWGNYGEDPAEAIAAL